MAGFSRSANAGAISGSSGRAALARVGRAGSLAFFGRIGLSGGAAMTAIWDSAGGGKRARRAAAVPQSEPLHHLVDVFHLRRRRKAVAHQLAPFEEVRRVAEIDGVVF